MTVLIEAVDLLVGAPEQQYRVARSAGMIVVEGQAASDVIHPGAAELLVDALIGYGLRGSPMGWTADIISRIDASAIPVLALDVPSGLDATSGECRQPCTDAANRPGHRSPRPVSISWTSLVGHRVLLGG